MKKILVLGDSHSEVFNDLLWKKSAASFSWKTVVVYGATLSGLSNPNSKTRTTQLFNNALETRKYDAVVTLLGEVDCGFVIWFYAERDNIDIYSAAQKAVENYQELLNKALLKSKVFVVSAPLPTIGDTEVHGNVAQERSKIKSTQKERTELTLWFNKRMEDFCSGNKIDFINLDADSKGGDGLVSKNLKNQNRTDHHYNKKAYVSLLEKHLLPKLLETFGDESLALSDKIDLVGKVASPRSFLIKDKDIDLIRDAAIAMEAIDINKAQAFMYLAHQFRPTGFFIKQKLEEYIKNGVKNKYERY